MNFQCTLGLFCKAGGELSAAYKNHAPNPVFTHISTYYSMLCLRRVCRTDSANQSRPSPATWRLDLVQQKPSPDVLSNSCLLTLNA